jgi:hypothetical protein
LDEREADIFSENKFEELLVPQRLLRRCAKRIMIWNGI